LKLKNKFLFNKYTLILENNEIVLFCEQNSLSFDSLKKLKIDLKKENFSITSINNNVFNKQFKDFNLKKLINSSIFIIYKKVIDYNTNFKRLQSFISFKFALCLLFQKKFYNLQILKQFSKINSLNRLIAESAIIINILVYIKLYRAVHQLKIKKAIIA
jgi:ribosomal protein L10